MNTKHSLRFAWLCLAWSSVFLFGALACDVPVTLELENPTPTFLPPTASPTTPPSLPTNTLPPPPLPPAATAPTDTQEPTAAPEISEVEIFLVAVGDNGASGKLVGCGDSLVPVRRQIAPTRQPILAALEELFAIKQQTFGQSGLYNALYQSSLHVERAEVDENRIATVVLTGQVRLGGECDTPRFKGQIEQTILSAGGVQSANILLNGKTIDEALSLR